jgi:hypothetical protein
MMPGNAAEITIAIAAILTFDPIVYYSGDKT